MQKAKYTNIKKILARNIWQHIRSKKCNEIEHYWIPTDSFRAHRGIAQEFKCKARNLDEYDIVVYIDQQWIVCIIHCII